MLYTRRDIGTLALAVPAAGLVPRLAGVQTKPHSLIGGVQIGLIAPYSFGRDATTAEAILENLVKLGISAVELQSDAAEPYAGAPPVPRFVGPGAGATRAPRPAGAAPGAPVGQPGPGAPGPGRPPALTPEQQAARQEALDALKKWRLSASMDRYKELRRKYNDAGVRIYAFKLALTAAMSDEEYDYTFDVAEALGADHLTMELPADGALTKRIGEFAAKRTMMVGYHTHTQATLTVFDEALAQSKYNGINVDIGHYVAGTSESPIPLIRRHHARFTSIHLKDRKKSNGPNVPWGQGDTPIAEVLQLMKKEKWSFPATIELEYPVPEGSTRVAEIARCLQFCRDALGQAT